MLIYDRQGREISMVEWAELLADDDVRQVARTEMDDAVSVSTVWLGLDHSFGGTRPLVFETMVFGGPLDMEQERYSTEAEALLGHQLMVAKVALAQDVADVHND